MLAKELIMATIERQYLPPLNTETTIAEADRQRVYDIVRKQLADLLEGDQYHYPDGVQKDRQARADDLDGLIGLIAGLQGRVNDPADILGDVVKDLRAHAKHFRARMASESPSDPIELPPERSPTTRDRSELYLEPNPFAPPMKSLPGPRQEWLMSRRHGGQSSRPERRTAPPLFFPFR